LLAIEEESAAGARMFQRNFGFKVGGSAIFLTVASGIRGGGALARRSAGFGTGTVRLPRTASEFSGPLTGAGCGFGLGNATIEGLFRRISSGTASGSPFFGPREGATVRVK
jgi:hypothetical protein